VREVASPDRDGLAAESVRRQRNDRVFPAGAGLRAPAFGGEDRRNGPIEGVERTRGVIESGPDENSVMTKSMEHRSLPAGINPSIDGRNFLELMIGLQPFPCLIVENRTARVALSNDEARRLKFDRLGGHQARDTESWSVATDDGRRLEACQVIAYMLGRTDPGDGVELTSDATGEPRSFRVVSRPLPVLDGSVALSMITFLDVTGQRFAEGALRDAVEARDELFSVATHELKDPLFSLQLSIQLLRHVSELEGPIPPHVGHHLEVGERQIERLARLIDNMLDVARIAHGRINLDPEILDLNELAQQVVTRFAGQAGSSGTIVTAEPGRPVIGAFDRLKLEQVIGNLLSNAIKYGAGKPIRVRVRGESDRAVVEVEDQGAGIAPEDQERVFGRFERASNGHRQASLGLGLYIVRSMVAAHGGTIELRSEPGRGSTFIVTIPCDGARGTRHSHESGGSSASHQAG
jgi:signal transduction histidine kinase